MSPRSEKQNAAIKDERREQILSAALRLFAKRGFAATKIGDIVGQAGISHGLAYHYFHSKEEIFYELLKRAMQASSESILVAERMPGRPADKIRMIAGYIMDAIGKFEDTAYYFMIVTHASVMEGQSEENRRLLEESAAGLEAMVRILKAGQEAGEVREGDAEAMATTFFAALQGLAMYKLSSASFVMPNPGILVNMVIEP